MREAISLDLGPLTRIMPIDPVPGGVAMAAIVSSTSYNLAKAKYWVKKKMIKRKLRGSCSAGLRIKVA
jgi:hypothetical protein